MYMHLIHVEIKYAVPLIRTKSDELYKYTCTYMYVFTLINSY